MDPLEATDLNARDTHHLDSNNTSPCMELSGSGTSRYNVTFNEKGLSTFRDLSSLPEYGTRILSLSQCRLYSTTHSTLQLSLSRDNWLKILGTLDIPPNMVELLHENNGGSWQHVSQCTGHNDCQQVSQTRQFGSCAYHICFKTSQFELLYARHDFHSKRNLVIIMGVDIEWELISNGSSNG